MHLIMRKLLIASSSYISSHELQATLGDDWEIHTCFDGLAASQLLKELHPDAMIIDLNLQMYDGLSLLMDHFPELPPIMLGVTSYYSKYIVETAKSLGVGDVLDLTISQFDIINRFQALYLTHHGINTALGMHLFKLSVNVKNDGYKYLYTAIPLCANADGAVRFHKELYPEVMRQCGATSIECVEHSIRFTIKDAWKRRDPKVWAKYFPVTEGEDPKCPTSKAFISTIAKML